MFTSSVQIRIGQVRKLHQWSYVWKLFIPECIFWITCCQTNKLLVVCMDYCDLGIIILERKKQSWLQMLLKVMILFCRCTEQELLKNTERLMTLLKGGQSCVYQLQKPNLNLTPEKRRKLKIPIIKYSFKSDKMFHRKNSSTGIRVNLQQRTQR